LRCGKREEWERNCVNGKGEEEWVKGRESAL
jgi:hypothetical protein